MHKKKRKEGKDKQRQRNIYLCMNLKPQLGQWRAWCLYCAYSVNILHEQLMYTEGR